MAFGVANSSLPGRGPTPGLRFALYAILAVVLMFLDRREGWMEQVRYGLQAATYPLQLAVSSPSAAWGWVRESVQTRDSLRAENSALLTRLRNLELRTMRYEALARENAKLRGLSTALPPVAEKWLVAEVVHVELDSLRPRVLINRGTNNGVFKAQAVLDDQGVLGQTTHVGPWSAEVILVTDPEHAIPVEIERTGVRTIAVGTGNDGELALPYLPGNADVKSGDLLVTSGMGGVFPQGYPVARVTEVHREAVQPLAQVRAAPLAHINRDREVMLVWFREEHPAAPVRDAKGDLPKGDPNAKPMIAPPKPAPLPNVEAGGSAAGGPAGAGTPATGAQRPGTATPAGAQPTASPTRAAGPRGTVPTPAPSSSAPAPRAPAAPDSSAPATSAPTSRAPTSAAPGSSAPGSRAPTSAAPDSSAPASRAPTSSAPTSRAPNSASPAQPATTPSTPSEDRE